jgi:hypothetical protein
MELLNTLASNTLISLITGGIIFSSQYVYRYIRLVRPVGRIWGHLSGNKTEIVITTAPEKSYAEHTTLVFPAEARAAAEIHSFISHEVKADCRIRFSSTFEDSKYDENLVVIGGPNHNQVTRELLSRAAAKSKFRFDEYSAVTPSGKLFTSKVDTSKNTENDIYYDVGVILRMRNPFEPKKFVTLLMGSRTHGCLVAARALLYEDARLLAKRLPKNEEFGLVATASIRGQEIYDLKIEEVWQI